MIAGPKGKEVGHFVVVRIRHDDDVHEWLDTELSRKTDKLVGRVSTKGRYIIPTGNTTGTAVVVTLFVPNM